MQALHIECNSSTLTVVSSALLAPGLFSSQICLASPLILMCFSVGRLHRLSRAVLISFRVVLTFQSKSANGLTVASSFAV